MRKITVSFLLFLPYLLFAQATRIVLEGKVTDALHKPIAYTTIQSIGTADGSYTEEGTECYFKFIVDGIAYLQKIDLNNGTKINTQTLGFHFPEKIRVMAGYAYFTYSDAQINGMFVRHLYRQKID